MYIGDSPEAREFRRRVSDFLAVETEQVSDRPAYLVLITIGAVMLLLAGGTPWMMAVLGVYIVAELSYGRHSIAAAASDLDAKGYRLLRLHHLFCIAAFVTFVLVVASHPSGASAWAAGLLCFGQALNCIGHETRSMDATRMGIATVAVTSIGAAFAITTAMGFERSTQLFALASTALLAIYFGWVAMNAARIRGKLVDRTDALRHAQKGEAVGRLTSGIAHDFNNLLTVMRGNIDLLSEVPEAERGKLLEEIGNATDRGGRLVGQLLSSARRGERRVEPVGLCDFLDAFAGFARRVLPANVELACRTGEGLTLRCDPSLLEAALLNLVVNARDAMPDGGHVTIVAEPGEAPSPAGRGGWVSISVTDDGPGMPPEVLARATEPFMTTKPAGLGTGLGLAMVREFADRTGGRFVLESIVGQGTTARLRLPT